MRDEKKKITTFSNRVMVVITQTSSVGSWVEAHVDGAQIANLEVELS